MEAFLHSLIGQILSYAIPVVIAWLLHSPLGSKLPKSIVDLLASLDSGTVQVIVQKAITMENASPEQRYNSVTSYVISIAKEHGISLSENQAETMITWLVRQFKAGNILKKG